MKRKRAAATMNDGCLDALQAEQDVRIGLRAAGLELRVSVVQCGSRQTLHWQFNDRRTGRRVLDYWPGSGTWLDSRKRRGTAGSPEEAAALAKRLQGWRDEKTPVPAAVVGTSFVVGWVA